MNKNHLLKFIGLFLVLFGGIVLVYAMNDDLHSPLATNILSGIGLLVAYSSAVFTPIITKQLSQK